MLGYERAMNTEVHMRVVKMQHGIEIEANPENQLQLQMIELFKQMTQGTKSWDKGCNAKGYVLRAKLRELDNKQQMPENYYGHWKSNSSTQFTCSTVPLD
jgi:hypothetical protein